MLHALSTLLNPSIFVTALKIALSLMQLILFAALLYLAIFYPHTEKGFYSWHPIKRILFLIFLPLIFLFKFMTARCHCGSCGACLDDD